MTQKELATMSERKKYTRVRFETDGIGEFRSRKLVRLLEVLRYELKYAAMYRSFLLDDALLEREDRYTVYSYSISMPQNSVGTCHIFDPTSANMYIPHGYTYVYPCYLASMSSKDVGLRIRVERELREEFQGACMAENKCASEVLREFMKEFAERRQGGKQADLFATLAPREPR